MFGVAKRKGLDVEVAAWAGVAHPDSVVAFCLRLPDGRRRNAAEWAEATFEQATAPLRALVWFGWRWGLGLRLAPRGSPGHVLGWTKLSGDDDTAVIEVDSRFLSARQVFKIEQETLVHGTVVCQKGRVGRSLWWVASKLHQVIVPFLLSAAGRREPCEARV